MKRTALKLFVEEDEELRKYIKTLIKGQVTSIMREQLKDIMLEVVNKKKSEFEEILRDEVKNNISWSEINRIMREEVFGVVREAMKGFEVKINK